MPNNEEEKFVSKSGFQRIWNKIKLKMSTKVDKVTGKGLSTNDYTTAEKNKLRDIEANAKANVQSDWNQTDTSADDFIKNKPTELPASDVPSWAKQNTKPSYTASEVGALPDNTHYVSYDEQSLTDEQKGQVRANIGAGSSSFSGSYNDLTQKPTKLSDFTDDLGSSPTHTHSQYQPTISDLAAIRTGAGKGATAVQDVNYVHTDNNYDSTDKGKVDALGTASSKNTGTSAGNVPVLDSNGKLDTNVLPALAITDTFVVSSQASMLALTAEVGDVCVRTDLNKSFILKTAGASTLSNWQELLTPTDAVSSVNGKTGPVTLTYSDVGAAAANHGHAYIPINGNSTINGGATGSPLTIKGYDSTTASTSIAFKDNVGNSRGYLGVNSSHQPVYIYGTEHRLAYYSDIPTNNSQLANGAGYITGITKSMVTAALGYTPGTSSFSGAYNDLSGKPSIPTESTVSGWGFTKNTGTVTSVRVRTGTGLSSSTSTAQTSSLDTTISIADGYKLPTSDEWNDRYRSTPPTTLPNGTAITNPDGANAFALTTTATSGSDFGIFYLSDDNAYVCNSSDNGYTFAVYDTDLTKDFSNVDTASFVVLSNGDGAKIRGNTVIHSGNISNYAITSHQSLSGYATQSWVQQQGYLTSHQSLTAYATKEWVGQQGYLTTYTDTKNTAGTTNKTATKMYLVGATSQGSNPQTYSNSNCYVGTDNCLYSNGSKVLTSHQSLAGYATESWVEGKGYLTSHQSLSGYATQTWVENKGYITGITSSMVTDALGYTPPTQDTTYQSLAAANRGTAVSLVTTGEKYTWDNKHTYRHTIRISSSKGTGIMVIITNSSTSCTGSGNHYPLASLLINAGFNSISNYYPVHLTSTAANGTISSSVIGAWGVTGYKLTFLIRSSGESMSVSSGDDGSAGWSYTDKVETLC